MLQTEEALMAEYDPQARAWIEYVENVVRGDDSPPFDEQVKRFDQIYAGRDPGLGPPLAWVPELARDSSSNLGRFMADSGLSNYEALHRWSTADRGAFWAAVLERLEIPFAVEPTCILGSPDPFAPHWLEGARLDITRACFTGDPNATAVISGGEQHEGVSKTTFGELERLVDRVAQGIVDMGLAPGAGVALYMPMTLECVAAYLGVVRAGHPVISIADSFAAEEIEKRLRLGKAGAIVTVFSFERGARTIELYGKVKAANAPLAIVITSDAQARVELRDKDVLWEQFLGPDRSFVATPGAADKVTNILFSSGTTGDPKAIPWTQTTPDQMRHGRSLPPGHPARRRRRVADEHRLDDGAVVDLRRAGQPCRYRPLRGPAVGPGVCPLHRAIRGFDARRGAVARARMAGNRCV